MDYIITIGNSETDESRDIYWINELSSGTPFGTLRECGYVPDGPAGTGGWSKPDSPLKATVTEWHRCPNAFCVNDKHEGSGHVDATGRSFTEGG